MMLPFCFNISWRWRVTTCKLCENRVCRSILSFQAHSFLLLYYFLKQLIYLKPSLVRSKVNNLLLGLSLGETTWLMMDSLFIQCARILAKNPCCFPNLTILCSLLEKDHFNGIAAKNKYFHLAFLMS